MSLRDSTGTSTKSWSKKKIKKVEKALETLSGNTINENDINVLVLTNCYVSNKNTILLFNYVFKLPT